MLVIKATNVNQALSKCLLALIDKGQLRSSRNGTVLAFPEPVSTVYTRPTERVLFSPIRNANPAFHLLESLWMLAGRNDVKFPATIVKNMKSYTDDQVTFWGAYGYRWRTFFGWDQIRESIHELTVNPESRRVVIAMWNAQAIVEVPGSEYRPEDFIVGKSGGLDVPCNTHIYFDRLDGKLNMTVCCRSNDILWGCYGANVVHMSILQEYMALAIGCPVGTYTQMSNDLHLYNTAVPEQGIKALAWDAECYDHYSDMGQLKPTPLWGDFEDMVMFDSDVQQLFRSFDQGGVVEACIAPYITRYFRKVVVPMLSAWSLRKDPKQSWQEAVSSIEADDWRIAMVNWLDRNFGGEA